MYFDDLQPAIILKKPFCVHIIKPGSFNYIFKFAT